MSKNHQAGSAATFVIIAIILAAATIGSIAFVVARGEQVRKDAAAKIAAEKAAQKPQDVAESTPPPTTTPTTDTPTTTQTPPQTNNSAALPTTGIELDIIRTAAVGLLAGTATSFALSRRSLKRHL